MQLPPTVTAIFASLLQQAQQGGAYIGLLAMNQPVTGETRKRAREQIRKVSMQELWDTAAAYINAEIAGAAPGSYVSGVPKAKPGADQPETFDAFERLNEAYLKDVLISGSPPLAMAQADALTGADLRQQFEALLQKSSCR